MQRWSFSSVIWIKTWFCAVSPDTPSVPQSSVSLWNDFCSFQAVRTHSICHVTMVAIYFLHMNIFLYFNCHEFLMTNWLNAQKFRWREKSFSLNHWQSVAKLFINERSFFSKTAHVPENAVLFLIAQPVAQRLNTFCLMMARHFQHASLTDEKRQIKLRYYLCKLCLFAEHRSDLSQPLCQKQDFVMLSLRLMSHVL